jgi:hypothetical protein
MARSELANAARVAHRNPNDPAAASLVDRRRVEYHAVKLVEQIRTGLRDVADVDVWAARIASTLPPFTGTEAAAAGRLAAALDARRTDDRAVSAA